MGASSSHPSWAPDSLPKKIRKLPDEYLELRHPNGSVVHVVGVRAFEAAGPAIVRQVIRAATPDSVLLQLCDERVPPVWELIERGTKRADGSLRDPLPSNPFDWNTASSDARLRSFQWWFGGGLDLEGLAALNGTCLGAAQASAAHEAARLQASTHLIDRQVSSTLHRVYCRAWREYAFFSGGGGDDDLADALAIVMAPVDADNLDNRRGAIDTVARALASDDDGAPSATAAAAAFRAARDTIGAERSEILAHKCHEALKTLGPGGVAVAVVGSEHVAAIGRQFGKTDPKKIEELLAGPPVSDSLIAAAAPTIAVGAPLALGQRFLPPVPKRAMWLAWAVLPAVYEMYIVRQRYDTYRGVAAVQAALECTA
jgi:hypothetical protein